MKKKQLYQNRNVWFIVLAMNAMLGLVNGTTWLWVTALAILYFWPTIIAFQDRKASRWLIACFNFAFGISVIGWFLTMFWAAAGRKGAPKPTKVVDAAKYAAITQSHF